MDYWDIKTPNGHGARTFGHERKKNAPVMKYFSCRAERNACKHEPTWVMVVFARERVTNIFDGLRGLAADKTKISIIVSR